MNKTINKFLLTAQKFAPELLEDPGFTQSTCGSFAKHRERIQKFKETVILKHLCRNKLNKACFAPDATYSDRKDLAKRTVLDKILKYRAYKIAINHKYYGYQIAIASMVHSKK